MVITKEQLRTLNHIMEVSFLKRLTVFVAGLLKKAVPADSSDASGAADPAQLSAMLLSRARSRGLHSEYEIAVYAACAVRLGIDFDQRPDLPFRTILARPATEPRLKAAQMSMELDRLTAPPAKGRG